LGVWRRGKGIAVGGGGERNLPPYLRG